MAKVFTFTPDITTSLHADKIIKGGTGYDIKSKLPEEAETVYPDYGLYPKHTDTAYGYLTRGCPRACPFCIVAEKEGRKTAKVAELGTFWRGQKKIKLLDPNITACPEATDLLKELRDTGAWVDYTQGLDIRLLTEEQAKIINGTKVHMLHFAYDMERDRDIIEQKLKAFRPYFDLPDRTLTVYVLTNYNTSHEFDLYRVNKIRELGYSPYVMIYEKETAPYVTRKLARYCNNRIIFHTIDRFEDYCERYEAPDLESNARIWELGLEVKK